MHARNSVRTLTPLSLSLLVAVMFGAVRTEASPDTTVKEAMRKMQTAMQASDSKALGPLFDLTKRKGAPEFERWVAISDRGRAALERGDFPTVKATCTECHDLYRAGYKAKYGSRAP